MADVTVKRLDELESHGGRFFRAGKGLGVTACSMNVLRFPPNYPDYREHDHASDGEEEIYVVLEGSATLQAGDESWRLERGTFARVAPSQKRKIVPGDEGVTFLAIGGPARDAPPPEE